MCAQDGPSDDDVHDNVLHYREDHFAQRSHCGKLNRCFLIFSSNFIFIFIAQRSHCGKLNRFYVRVRVNVSARVRVRIMDFVNFGVFSLSTQTLTPSRHFSHFFNFSALHEPDCNKNFPDTP